MDISLHKFCNLSNNNLQRILIDGYSLKKYPHRMSTKEEAGRRIRASRLAKSMTLLDVHTQITSISVSKLSNWEQGLNMIGVDDAKKLAPVLGVSSGYLLTIDDAPLTKSEEALLNLYRHSDERGKSSILHIAQAQPVYADSQNDNNQDDEPLQTSQ